MYFIIIYRSLIYMCYMYNIFYRFSIIVVTWKVFTYIQLSLYIENNFCI